MLRFIFAPFVLLAASCASTTDGSTSFQPVEIDSETRAELFGAVSSLEGRWESVGMDGAPAYTEFEVSSAGSVVRECMLKGTEHEMTNMYTLDGNVLQMTHYCAVGNQPHMRATALKDGRIAFEFQNVSDLKSADEIYMGEMTLVIHDKDRIEQQWRSFKGGEPGQEMLIEMKRVR